jgi:hypothetical protein
MTLFAEESARDTPSWMLAHHPLSTPDALIPMRDPAELALMEERAEKWSEVAETQRDPARRLYILEDRPTGDGPVLWRAHRQTTPAAAWAWFHGFHMPAGHRLVLLDTTKGEK